MMRRTVHAISAVGGALLLAAAMALVPLRSLEAAPAERYLHVRVNDDAGGETVRVNLPLSLAEKVLPTIDKGKLHHGKVRVCDLDVDSVDLHALLEAVRSAPDNEFVSVQGPQHDIRVAKSNGNLVVHIRDNHEKHGQKVIVTIPMPVVQALVSSGTNELDLVAAVRALENAGDTLLVSVEDGKQTVRVWVDSNNASE
jgi:hypothetical protein